MSPPNQPSAPSPFKVEFFEADNGSRPVDRWLTKDLTAAERRSVAAALRELVAEMGSEIVTTEFGKNLGGGILELRLRQSEDELLRRLNRSTAQPQHPEDDGVSIMLRVFLQAHGVKRILVLHGYSKGRDDSKKRQQQEISEARTRLARWQLRQAREAKALKRQQGKKGRK